MGRQFEKGILTPQVNRRYKLPKGLWQHGFGSYPTKPKPANRESVNLIRQYIKAHWVQSKKLNKFHTSTTLAFHISEKLGITVYGGEVVVAAIFEGYRYEQSVRNAFFWADTDMVKPTL